MQLTLSLSRHSVSMGLTLAINPLTPIGHESLPENKKPRS